MADDVVELPGIGHNQPPEVIVDPKMIVDPFDTEALRVRLARDYAPELKRMTELELGAKKLDKPITTKADDQKVLDWLEGQCKPAAADYKAAHDKEARPHNGALKIIHEMLRRLEKFQLAIAPVRRRHEAWMFKEEAEQRAREAEQRRNALLAAQRAAAAAAHARAEALEKEKAGRRTEAIEAARRAEQEQERAELQTKIAEAPGAPVHQHGELTQATSYIKEGWGFRLLNPGWVVQQEADALPDRFWTYDLASIQEAIDEAKGEIKIPGVEIFADRKIINRKC